MKTLISFLGKGVEKKTGYRQTCYSFDSGEKYNVPYFGIALTHHLRPDRLVLMGTSGSMWDVFFDQQGTENFEDLINLSDAVAEQRVTQDMLDKWEPEISKKLGLPVTCRIIPYLRDAKEQSALLAEINACISPNESVFLDVTHGFRHLPMLALVAARYLARVASVRIEGIFYGALEMTENGETPVLKLDSLLHILDWVEAMAVYYHCGDYGVFAPLLERDGMAPHDASHFATAAFFERTSNPVKAREKLTVAAHALDGHNGALAKLFKDQLSERISWYRKQNRHEWELALADAYFQRRDYLRSAIFLYEAFVSRAAIDCKRDLNVFDQRKEAWEEAKKGQPKACELEYLRNALAHGVRPQHRKIRSIVGSEEKIHQKIKDFRNILFS